MSSVIINPHAFGELTAQWGDALVDLSWSEVPGAITYEVGVATLQGGPYLFIDVGNVLAYELGGLRNGVTYYIVRRAIVGGFPQGISNEVSGSPSNSNDFVQMDADAGWRGVGQSLQAVQSQYARTWGGYAGDYLRAVRGIFNNIQAYPEAYLPLSARPSRVRYRIRDGQNINDCDFTFHLRSQNPFYSENVIFINWLNGGGVECFARTNGASTLLANGSNTPRASQSAYLVEIWDTGTTIQFFVNGSLRLSVNTAQHNSFYNLGWAIYTGSSASVVWMSCDQ